MEYYTPWTNEFRNQVFGNLGPALGWATVGFALAYASFRRNPANVDEVLVAALTPISLSAIFFRLREQPLRNEHSSSGRETA